MKTIDECIKERRSVRSYRPDIVPQADLEAIAEAGICAASGMGKQSSVVICVTDKELRDKISRANAAIMGAPEGTDPFYGAPVIFVVAARKEIGTAVYDGSLTLGSMMLKAYDLGLGSCWIHRAKEEFETELGAEILAKAGLEGEYVGVGHLAVGYVNGEMPAAKEHDNGRVRFI